MKIVRKKIYEPSEQVIPGAGSGNSVATFFADAATIGALPSVSYSSNVLTATTNGVLPSQDGITLTMGQILLVKNQSTTSYNGLYEVTDIGSGLTPFILTRPTYYDETAEIYPSQVNILGGTTNSGKYFLETTIDPIIGTDPITYITISQSQAGNYTPLAFVDTVADTALPNTPTYLNGTTLVGNPGYLATYTSSTNTVFPTLQGLTPFVGMKVLVMGEADQTKNGNYQLVTLGSATTKWQLRRIFYTGSQLYPVLIEILASNYKGYIYQQNNKSLVNATLGSVGNITFTNINASSAIPQTNKIYVDAQLGINAASSTAGQIQNPYQTVEYVLANVTNTGTVTATTANNSATLTSVSSTSNISKGQYITGAGIPYNTTVVSFTSTTIVLSQPCTASATVTTTWWTPYELILSGSFVAASNWFKPGFFINAGNSSISWGSLKLFSKTVACLVPEIIIGGRWFGTSITSQFIYSSSVSSSHNILIDIKEYYSVGLGYQISLFGASSFNSLNIKCPYFYCTQGYCGQISGTNIYWDGYKYGLAGGITFSGNYHSTGKTETSASANALYQTGTGSTCFIYDEVYGNFYMDNQGGVNVFSKMQGASMTFITGSYYSDIIIAGDISCGTVSISGNGGGVGQFSGNIIFSGNVIGAVTNSKTSGSCEIKNLTGSFTGSNASETTIKGGYNFNDNSYGIPTITLSNTAQLTVVDCYTNQNYIIPNSVNNSCGLSIGSGCYLKILGKMSYYLVATMAGTIELSNATVYHCVSQYGNSSITGKIYNNNSSIQLLRIDGAEAANSSPCIRLNGGIYEQVNGSLFCTNADSLSGLIRQSATGGNIVLRGQPYLKVANGLAPLQILSNTGTAQNVFDFGLIDNCAVGFRLANTFSDTSYGTAYAPNLLINGTKYEATTNTW